MRPETRNIPKELFTWTPPKTTAWVKEYIDTHGKPPIYKIKLKYLEYVILPVNGPYHAKGQPPRLGNYIYDPAISHESFWEELITSIRKTGQRTPVNVYQQVNDNGEIHWRVLDGQHRCNALLDIYGPEYEVDCSLDSNMENYVTPYLYLDKFGTHIKDNMLHNYHPTDNKVWTIWKFTIGSFSDERTKEHDNIVAILRTIIVVVNVLTCLIIVANIIHNW